MKDETQVIHKDKVKGVPCRGAICRSHNESRLALALGFRNYICDKCGAEWSWTDPIPKQYR